MDFTAKSVLVEVEEEELEELEEPSAMSAPPSDTKITTNYEAVEDQLETEDVKTFISTLVEVEEQEEPESEDEQEEQSAAESEEFQPSVDYLAPQEPRNLVAISDDEVDEDLPENRGDGNTDNVKKCRMFLVRMSLTCFSCCVSRVVCERIRVWCDDWRRWIWIWQTNEWYR